MKIPFVLRLGPVHLRAAGPAPLRRGEARCPLCRAPGPRDAYRCWACGRRLIPRTLQGRPAWTRPEALRHYSSDVLTLGRASFIQGAAIAVLVVSFGVMAGSKLLQAFPNWPPDIDVAGLAGDPLHTLLPGFFPRHVTVLPAGAPFGAQAVVAQVAQPRREAALSGRTAPEGREFAVAAVVIHNQGTRPVTYLISDWKARDSRGRRYSPERIASPGWLRGGQIAPGQLVQADVAFLVPAGDRSLAILFEPRFDRTTAAVWELGAPSS